MRWKYGLEEIFEGNREGLGIGEDIWVGVG
jgi:hypothetical protein